MGPYEEYTSVQGCYTNKKPTLGSELKPKSFLNSDEKEPAIFFHRSNITQWYEQSHI